MHHVHNAGMSDLAIFLGQNGLTQEQFAERIGVDQSTISRLLKNKMRPSLTLAVNIERETGGAIPASAWLRSADGEAEGAA